MGKPARDNGTGNVLLDGLPVDEWKRLERSLERVDFDLRDVVYERGKPITAVYFPTSCVVSLVSEMHDGRVVEVATVGSEGMAGLPVFLRAGYTSAHMSFAQVAGEALKLGVAEFSDALDHNGAMHNMLQRYTQALFTQVAQTSACNRLHPLKERCARWLLMTHDRVGNDSFHLTQEFLAQMLGVQRSSVNVAAAALQEDGAIRYSRGQLEIRDRRRLEEASCECYAIVAEEFARLACR